MECNQCQRIFTRSDNLRRHMKIHQVSPNSLQTHIRNQPYPNSSQESESRPLLQNRQEEEDRLERLEVLNGEIDSIIDQSVEKMKEEIWVCMAESHEFEETERKGGSLASLTGQKKDEDEDEWIEQKEDEDDTSKVEQKEDEDEEEEEIFLDVIRKDAEKLG